MHRFPRSPQDPSHASLGGWQIKLFSIAHSPFEEVLSFDADNVALADPTPLFDDASYRGRRPDLLA
jgi:hypothetical protein